MATFDIPLQGNRRPQFPDVCVGCDLEHPQHDAHISVLGSRSTLSWAIDATLLATGTVIQGTNVSLKLAVPCCPTCAKQLERRHFWKTILTYVSGFLGAGAAVGVILAGTSRHWGSGLTVTLGLLALLLIVSAPVIWEMVSPPAFTVTPLENQVTYEFRSEKCASIFRALNRPEGPKSGAQEIPRPSPHPTSAS